MTNFTVQPIRTYVFTAVFVLVCSQRGLAQEDFYLGTLGTDDGSRVSLEVDSSFAETLSEEGVVLAVAEGDFRDSTVDRNSKVEVTNRGCIPLTEGRELCTILISTTSTEDVQDYFMNATFYTIEANPSDGDTQKALFLACNAAEVVVEKFGSDVKIASLDTGVCTLDKRAELRDLNGLSIEMRGQGFGVTLDRNLTRDGTFRVFLDGTISVADDTTDGGGIELTEATAKLDVEFANIYVLGTVLGTDIPNYYPIRGSLNAGFELGQNLQVPISGNLTVGVPFTDTLIHIYHNAAGIERNRFPMLFSVSYEFAPTLRDASSEDDRNLTHRLVLDANYNIPILQRMDLELDWTGTWLIADSTFESNLDTTFKVFFQEGYDSYLTFGFETGADAPLFTDASTIKVGYSTVLEALLGSLGQPKEE